MSDAAPRTVWERGGGLVTVSEGVAVITVDEVDCVIDLSRTQQATLGQLPFEAFRLFASDGRVLGSFDGGELAGYAIYRIRKRTGVLVLVHLCVAEEHRGKGHAQRLVDAVCDRHPYAPGLAAWCREDYPAHHQWPSLGFTRGDGRPGRSRAGSRLIHWWRPINALTLFTYVPDEAEMAAAALDTNVFRDIVEPRPGFPESIALGEPWLMDSVDLVITEQLVSEVAEAEEVSPQLRGTTSRFKILHAPSREWMAQYEELKRGVGSNSIEPGDYRQLAQAAAAGARYFVTRDQKVLNHRDAIEAITGLTVVPPLELTLATHADQFELDYRAEALRESDLEVRHPTSLPTKTELQPFVDQPHERTAGLLAELGNVAGEVGAGARLWEVGPQKSAPIAIAATSLDGSVLRCHCIRVRADKHRVTFARQLLHLLREHAVADGLGMVKVYGHIPTYLERALTAEGFSEGADGWVARCQLGFMGPHDTVPDVTPPVRSRELDAQQISQLERVLWPLKIVSGNVPTYIVPIQPTWARALFDDAPRQAELIPRPGTLSLAREHVYYRSLNRTIRTPARLLWWVSGTGPNSGMRAASWLESTVEGRPLTLHRRFGSQGIYSREDVEAIHHRPGGTISALVFSRTETFVSPIRMKAAREIFPAIGENGFLRTARLVGEHVFAAFYEVGRPPT